MEDNIRVADRETLRLLARQVAEAAAQPIMAERRDLWRRHNDLMGLRPMVLCDPENSWQEIIREDQLVCTGDLARAWERRLRKQLFWGTQMGDDRVLEPVFELMVTAAVDDFGVQEVRHQSASQGSFTWEAPIKGYADLALLKAPSIRVDREVTERRRQLALEVFDGILEVTEKNYWWWSLGLTYPFVLLRGLQQLMYDLYDEPDGVHALMRHIRDVWLWKLDFLEQSGLLSMNSTSDFIGSHSHGYTNSLEAVKPGSVRPMNMWGFGESQETVSVSPGMFEEFVFQYQLPLLERFGLNYYGCCEPLHDRMHLIKRIPRLRKVSVSPWANREIMADELKGRCVFSWKPNPAPVSVNSPDWDSIRKDIKSTLRIAKGCAVEIILKDLHTLSGKPQNARQFCRIAQEEAQNIQ